LIFGVHELETERIGILEHTDSSNDKPQTVPISSHAYTREASPHILSLLRKKQALSEPRGIHRRLLDEQLINNVKGVKNNQAVSWGIIELASKGEVDHEGGKKSGRPIGKVWLLGTPDKPAS
jgi:hypothetical protein